MNVGRREHLEELVTGICRAPGDRVELPVSRLTAIRSLCSPTAERTQTGFTNAAVLMLPRAWVGELGHRLSYKATWYGAELHLADRWFASSKTCSGCGHVKAKLYLHERLYVCDDCGLEIDRDLNAAINLARWPTRQQKSPPLQEAA